MLPLSFDEGYNLQVAWHVMHSLRYATWVSYPFFDPWITTGPTVLLPMAPLTLLHPLAPRLIMLLYTCIFFYIIWKFIFSKSIVNLLFVVVILFLSPLFIWHAFTAYGELPGLTFVLLSYIAYTKNKYALAGLFVGLACITKMQYALAFLPLILVHWRHGRTIVKMFLISAAVVVGWYTMLYLWMGSWDNTIIRSLAWPRPDFLLYRNLAIPVIAIFVGLIAILKKNDVLIRLLGWFLIVWTIYMLFFGPNTQMRLFLPALWVSFIVLFRKLDNLIICILFVSCILYLIPCNDYLCSYNMQYRDQIEAARWVHKQPSVSGVGWLKTPEIAYLAQKSIKPIGYPVIFNKFLKPELEIKGIPVFENSGYIVYSESLWEKKK